MNIVRCFSYNGKYTCSRRADLGSLSNGECFCSDHVTAEPHPSPLSFDDILSTNELSIDPREALHLIDSYLLSIREGGMPELVNIDEWEYARKGLRYTAMRATSVSEKKILIIKVVETIVAKCSAVELSEVIGRHGTKRDVVELYMRKDHHPLILKVLLPKLEKIAMKRLSDIEKCRSIISKAMANRTSGMKPPNFGSFKRLILDIRKVPTMELLTLRTLVRAMSSISPVPGKVELSHKVITKSLKAGEEIRLSRKEYLDKNSSTRVARSLSIREYQEDEVIGLIKSKVARLVDPHVELKMLQGKGKSYNIRELTEIAERLSVSTAKTKKQLALNVKNRVLPPVLVITGNPQSRLAMSMVVVSTIEFELQAIENHVKTRSQAKAKIPTGIRTTVWREHSNGQMDCQCFSCGTNIKWERWHCGHIISERNGGEISKDNLRPTCNECNLRMGTCDMYEYMVSIGREKSVPVYPRFLFSSIREDTKLVLAVSKKKHRADYSRVEKALNMRRVPFEMRMSLIRKLKASLLSTS